MNEPTKSQNTYAFIGNWEIDKSSAGNGFDICRFDSESGGLQLLKSAFLEISVGAACLHPKRSILYCTDETKTLPGYFLGGGGQVYALRIDPESGDLTEINHLPSFGSLPSSLTVDATGDYLIVTHHTDRVPITKVIKNPSGQYRIALEYDDATTVLFPLREDGGIGDPCDVYRHSGSGGVLPRQTHPQLHSVSMSPCGNLFAVCDKGNDEVVCFSIDRETSSLNVLGDGLRLMPGSSPRYSVFHPKRPYLFVNHETKAVVSSIRYDPGGLNELVCTVSSLPDDCEDCSDFKQSDIKIHPSGRYLYSMIRGLDAISVFDINEETGCLRRTQTATLNGQGPRGCAITPDGRFMLIAALTSREVLTWTIHEDGSLAPFGTGITHRNPGYITFFSANERASDVHTSNNDGGYTVDPDLAGAAPPGGRKSDNSL